MEHSPIKYPGDGDVEDGEISDGTDGGYTPLARPSIADGALSVATTQHHHHHHMQTTPIDALPAISKMEEASDKDDSLGEASTDSDSDNAIINQPRDGRAKRSKIRIKPQAIPVAQSSAATAVGTAAHRKNNIWAAGLQEESLMENLKGCGVDREASSAYDRSVESYDYSLRFRLNGENALKRRKSSNSDSSNERPQAKYVRQFQHAKNKRGRANGGGGTAAAGDGASAYHQKKKNVRLRLGRRSDDSSSNDAGQLDGPRTILDLEVITAQSTNETVAKDLASKLHEEKDELMLRIIEILGNELPLLVFAETQRIEANGGMLIMNGQRRRTPGGVFLFLLKNSGDLSADHRKAIFTEESRKQNREQKLAQAQKRDRKVEQLKQTLRIENELTALATRNSETQPTATAGGERDETLNNLSNPPPSPVTDGNRENSSDFDTHTIKHVVNMASPEKSCSAEMIIAAGEASAEGSKIMPGGSSTTTTTTAPYEDDFLDMHCDDMDMF